MALTVALVAAVAALAGVYVGGHQQHDAWRRNRRMDAALEMVQAVDAFLYTLPTADRAVQEHAGTRVLQAHTTLALVGQPRIVKTSGRCVFETRRLLFEVTRPEDALSFTAQLQLSRNEFVEQAGAALGFREGARRRRRSKRDLP